MADSTLAENVVAAMLRDDRCTPWLGMNVESVAPGAATVTMRVTENMVNGHNTAHGGMVFSLADSAFAFACNSHNRRTVAAGCQIEYLKPAMLGDQLRAAAVEVSRGNRLGLYDVTVTNQRGETVALFRGKSYRVGESLLEDATSNQA
jgi:acyl-CoA thioesterase